MAVSVTTTAKDPNGTAIVDARMLVRLVASASDPTVPGWKPANDFQVQGYKTVAADSVSGLLSIALERNSDLEPDNTYYEAQVYANGVTATLQFVVPSSGAGPFDLYDLLVSPPPALTPLHESAADPHTQYVLEAAVPGGELGGTYAVPTVDAVHSGSSHADLAATAAAAVVTHAATAHGSPLSGDNPLALGVAAPGAGIEVSRDDHVHPTTGLSLSGHDHSGVYDLAGAAATAVAAHDDTSAHGIANTADLARLSVAQTWSALQTFEAAAAATLVAQARVLADANPRFSVAADGTLSWGPGNGVADAVLARSGVARLSLTGGLTASGQFRAPSGGTSGASFTGGYGFSGDATVGIGADSTNFAFWIANIIRFNLSTAGDFRIPSDHFFSWASSTNNQTAADLKLYRDAANVLAQRNGTAAQAFRLYNTYTDVSNYERGKFGWNANVLEIGTEAGGTGALRAIKLIGGTVGIASGPVAFSPGLALAANYAAAVDAWVQIVRARGSAAAITTAHATALILATARNTIASPQAVQSGDVLGIINFGGYGTSHHRAGASIYGEASETYTGSTSAGRLVLATTPSGAIDAPVARWQVEPTGHLRVSGAYGLSLVNGVDPVANTLLLAEVAEPANPAANNGVLFMKDNGSGKSELCARFASGVSIVIATEP